MNSNGENIYTAFKVIENTYTNLAKFFSELDRVGADMGFISITPRFLRWKSDINPEGWLISSFIKLYQLKSDPFLEDDAEIRNGLIYGVEVLLGDEENSDVQAKIPQIFISKYEYDYIAGNWKRLPSVSEHWGFYWPLRNLKDKFIQTNVNNVFIVNPISNAKNEYWGLEKVTFKKIPLMEVDSTGKIKERIFEQFLIDWKYQE